MSSRGINFLDQWIANNVPETTKADVISVHELTRKLIADARCVGIRREEIYEEVQSLYRAILDAIVPLRCGGARIGLAGPSETRNIILPLRRPRGSLPYDHEISICREHARQETADRIGALGRLHDLPAPCAPRCLCASRPPLVKTMAACIGT